MKRPKNFTISSSPAVSPTPKGADKELSDNQFAWYSYQVNTDGALAAHRESLRPITLPLTIAVDRTAIRGNSLTIKTFIQSSLKKLGKRGGIAAYVSDCAVENNETVEVLSEGAWIIDYKDKPELLDACLWSLSWAYAQQLDLLAECQALLKQNA
jgi:hypothetical protein